MWAQEWENMRSVDAAHRLLSSGSSKAFNPSLEPRKSHDIYNTGRLGLGCLLARRLMEAGARWRASSAGT
jgi:hypothetical protein